MTVVSFSFAFSDELQIVPRMLLGMLKVKPGNYRSGQPQLHYICSDVALISIIQQLYLARIQCF